LFHHIALLPVWQIPSADESSSTNLLSIFQGLLCRLQSTIVNWQKAAAVLLFTLAATTKIRTTNQSLCDSLNTLQSWKPSSIYRSTSEPVGRNHWLKNLMYQNAPCSAWCSTCVNKAAVFSSTEAEVLTK
jgi:hypothetical protein